MQKYDRVRITNLNRNEWHDTPILALKNKTGVIKSVKNDIPVARNILVEFDNPISVWGENKIKSRLMWFKREELEFEGRLR